MLQLTPVQTPEEFETGFRKLYTEAFPPDERRDWQQLVGLLNHPQYNLFQIYFQDKFIGFISKWKLSEFNFIEHFAIQPTDQGKGLGSEVICQLTENDTTPIILEAEEPTSADSRRRIRFYENLNFRINSFDYFQPPYSTGKNAVKMLLLSYPDEINEIDSKEISDQIHRVVYQIQD